MADRLARLLKGLFGNKRMKLMSLGFAIVVWFVINEATNFQVVISDVPVNVLVDEGWAVLDRSTTGVDVLFRGSQEDIGSLSPEYTKVTFDLRGRPHQSEWVLAIDPHNVKRLGGARVVEVRPNTITLRLDQKGAKQVPVTPLVEDQPPEGIAVEKTKATPAFVTISGSRRRLDEVRSVHTEPIALAGRLRSFKARAPLVPPDRDWTVEPDMVEVEVTLVEQSATIEFNERRITALMPPGRGVQVVFKPAVVDVVMKGRTDRIQELKQNAFTVYVDCSRVEPGVQYDLPVQVHAPPGLQVDSITPAMVRVEVANGP